MKHRTKNPMKLDDTDRKILALLQENARIPNAEIARRIDMAPSAVLERIRKMERRGIILGYETRINPRALGLGLTAFTFVRSEEAVGTYHAGEDIAAIPGVQEVHHTAGHDCYLVKVRVHDTEAFSHLLQEIGGVGPVRDSRTTMVLNTVKETTNLPLGNGKEDD